MGATRRLKCELHTPSSVTVSLAGNEINCALVCAFSEPSGSPALSFHIWAVRSAHQTRVSECLFPFPHHRPSPRLERAVTGTRVFSSALVPHRQTGGAVGSEGGESGRVVLGCLCKRFGPSLGRFASTRGARPLSNLTRDGQGVGFPPRVRPSFGGITGSQRPR